MGHDSRTQTGMALRGLKGKFWGLPGYSRAGQWPVNRDLSEARQGCNGAESKAAFWGGAETSPIREQVYVITRLGTWDARPPDKAKGP